MNNKSESIKHINIKDNIYIYIKRLFDIIIGFIGCLFLIPITLLVYILKIKDKDSGPIFYKQIRIGKDEKPFYIYKYRTMVINSDEVLKNILKDPKYKKEWKKYHELENDPRITSYGNFLRKTSLDEIPQFIKGDYRFSISTA